MQIGLVTSVRNEAVYLIEWIAHHRALGFGPILVYENDSVDGSAELLSSLDQQGVVHYRPNTAPGFDDKLDALPPIQRALRRAGTDPLVQGCDYVMVADIDEFLVLPKDETPSVMLDRLDRPDIVSLPWRIFGSCGLWQFAPGSVVDRFPMAARTDDPGTKRPFWQVKSIFRPVPPAHMRQHAPTSRRNEHPSWRTADGRTLPAAFSEGHALSQPDFECGSFHHYHVKSQAEYFVKILRGYGDQKSVDAIRPGINGLTAMDRNEIACPMPDALMSMRNTQMTSLRAISDVSEAEALALASFRKMIKLAMIEIRHNTAFWAPAYLRNTPEHEARVASLLAQI